jgi:glycosyltransferase involved in cell wall biosynthesis
MRIAFDGTTLTPGRTGVGYYTEHLLHHLAREVEASGDELIVVSNQPIDSSVSLPAHVQVHDRRRFPLRIGWIQLYAARVLDDIGADVAHFTNGMVPLGTRAARVVTVHDMSLRLYPWCHPARRLVINRPLLSVAIRVADTIVTVSNSARSDLLRLHGVTPDRVVVAHEAAAPQFRPMADPVRRARIRTRYALPEQFALYVGAIEPRKNLPRLMAAFAAARAQGVGHELVCVGPYGWSSRDLYAEVDRLGLGQVVHFTGYLPLEDLPVVYSLADFFVFPSIYEGFGLPVIEAMACGTPVITANTSSLAEIASGAALTVDPTSTEALAAAIVELAKDPDRRHALATRGLARARQFSWARTAKEMLGLYRQAAGLAVAEAAGPIPRQSVESSVSVNPLSPGATS